MISRQRLNKLLRKARQELPLSPPWDVNSNIWAKEIGKVLRSNFPAYRWAVQMQREQGVAFIYCLSIRTEWKIVIRLQDLDYPDLAIVKVLAGEFLERWNLDRHRTDEQGLYDLKRDARGQAFGMDVHGVPKSNVY